EDLLTSARRLEGATAGIGSSAIVESSSLETRLHALLSTELDRTPLTQRAAAATAIVSLVVVALISVLQPIARAAPPVARYTGPGVHPTALSPAPSASPSPAATASNRWADFGRNVERTRIGMTYAEVVEIMGQPPYAWRTYKKTDGTPVTEANYPTDSDRW